MINWNALLALILNDEFVVSQAEGERLIVIITHFPENFFRLEVKWSIPKKTQILFMYVL